jgi:hypothetical protein
MRKAIFFMFSLVVIISCRKGTKYDKIPKISFNDLSDSVIKASTEKPIFIKFKFQDGDGDIGFNTKNLYLIDLRFINDTQRYLIPDIPEKFDPTNGLSGIIQLETNGAFLALRNDTIHKKMDTINWVLYMKDKAGNQSNIIAIPRLILKDSL